MKFSTTTIVFAFVLCVTSFAEAKPTLITTKILLKKYVVPRVLSGEWKFPSLYVPYPLSQWWPLSSGSESSPTVVYHSLSEDELQGDNSTPEVQPGTNFNNVQPVPPQQQQLPNEVDVRGPVYIAETPAVRHVAPLPQGYTEDVHIANVQPAPGTVA